MAIFQKAYDILKILDDGIESYVFDDMIVDPYPVDDEWHEEDEDYIEFDFRNIIHNYVSAVMIPCTKTFARQVHSESNDPCKESTWQIFGICDDSYSEVNFDYYMQIGGLGYSEGE